jgi:enamine deaminase RidA (YjgF/YER057c/UK114 family)
MIDRRSMLAVGAFAATAAAVGDAGPAQAAAERPGERVGHLVQPDGVAPGKGYSQVVWGAGRVVAIAGQTAVDEAGNLVGAGDPAAQARQVFENLRRCLRAVGADFGDVLSLTVLVTDIGILPQVRAARDAVIDTTRPPAATSLEVRALAQPGTLVEIEALALTGRS